MRNITFLFVIILLVGCGGRDSGNHPELENLAGKQLETIRSPDSVVVKRISTTVSGEQSLSDFQPLTGKKLAEIQNMLLDVDSYDWKTSKDCLRVPGILIQFSKGSDQSEIRICFECIMLGFAPGEWEDFDPIENKLISWAQSVFPNDDGIQSLSQNQDR